MREVLVYFKEDRVLKFAFTFSSSLLLLETIFLILTFAKLPPLIPLYLQRSWGDPQIAAKEQIVAVPAITALLLVVNILLAVSFYKDNPLVGRVLLWGQTLLSFLSALAVVKILLLVI